MNVHSGLAESAAEVLVGLMAVSTAGVDTGYIGRFVALDTTGDRRARRQVERRLSTDAQSLEASLAAGLGEVEKVLPIEAQTGFRLVTPPQLQSGLVGLIEELLTDNRMRAAELNAFCADHTETAEDGRRLLAVIIELDECRRALNDVDRPLTPSSRGLERLQVLDAKRRRVTAQIRSRHPVTVRPQQVQDALQRQYEQQRAELVEVRDQSPDDAVRVGFDEAIEQLDAAHELALRRQSVAEYGVQPSPPPSQPAGGVQQSVLAQLEQQRAQLVSMRDADLTAQGRAAYDQAIAQLDVGMEMARRQTAPPEEALTDDQRHVADQAAAEVAAATAQLDGLGSLLQAGSDMSAHLMTHMNEHAGLTADRDEAEEERLNAHRAMLSARSAAETARRSGVQADFQNAVGHYEQTRKRLEAAEARVAEIQARIQQHHQRLSNGPG